MKKTLLSSNFFVRLCFSSKSAGMIIAKAFLIFFDVLF